MSCGIELAPGQWWRFCGETDMGQSMPALCTNCGGEFKPKSNLECGYCKNVRFVDSHQRPGEGVVPCPRCNRATKPMTESEKDAALGRAVKAFMAKAGPIKTVSGKDVYSFVVTVERDAGLDAAITTAIATHDPK